MTYINKKSLESAIDSPNIGVFTRDIASMDRLMMLTELHVFIPFKTEQVFSRDLTSAGMYMYNFV